MSNRIDGTGRLRPASLSRSPLSVCLVLIVLSSKIQNFLMTSDTQSRYCSRTLRPEVQLKRLAHVEKAAMPSALQKRPSLPVNRAFVVQFRAEAELEQGVFTGRVEHVLSGQATKFSS